MGSFISGNEALMPALYRAGIETVYSYDNVSRRSINDIFESSIYKELKLKRIDNPFAAVFLAADSALAGYRTACITTPDTLMSVARIRDSGRRLRNCIFVMIYDQMPDGFIRAAAGMNLPLWIADDVSRMDSIIKAASDHSDMEGKPCIMLMQHRLLIEHAIVTERVTRRRMDLVSESGDRRRHVIRQCEADHNSMMGNGDYGVIAIGEACGYVEEIAENQKNFRLMKMDNPIPWPKAKVETFLLKIKKLLIIETDGYVSDSIKGMLSETDRLHLSIRDVRTEIYSQTNPGKALEKDLDNEFGNDLETVVFGALSVFFESGRRYLKSVEPPEEIPNRKKPGIPEIGRRMCAGCPMREQVVRYILAAGKNVRLTEELYCAHIKAEVSTGIKASGKNHMIATTQPEKLVKTGIPTIRIKNDCQRAGNELQGRGSIIMPHIRIIERSCIHCRECIDMTGCPALWDNGITAKIDTAVCVGCGLCAMICRKGAIVV